MKSSLVFLILLKRSLVFPILLFSSISLHWSLRKAVLSLLAILWNSAFKWAYLSFSPLLFASLLFTEKKVGKTTRPFKNDLNQIPYDYIVEERNRFKGLDLIDKMPDELWMQVHDIVQETGTKTIPKKKKWKEAEWLSEEGLQIAVKRREAKSNGEKERYTRLNAEFQRIARRDKKAFFSDQCKEIEENNRMGKTRD